jgi:hypothetical protein
MEPVHGQIDGFRVIRPAVDALDQLLREGRLARTGTTGDADDDALARGRQGERTRDQNV